jgi:hypothetical protein
MLAPHAGDAGSNPARVTSSCLCDFVVNSWSEPQRHEDTKDEGSHGQVVQLVDTRRSERRARMGVGVRLSPWSLDEDSGARIQEECPPSES